jgi:hypothetical protein
MPQQANVYGFPSAAKPSVYGYTLPSFSPAYAMPATALGQGGAAGSGVGAPLVAAPARNVSAAPAVAVEEMTLVETEMSDRDKANIDSSASSVGGDVAAGLDKKGGEVVINGGATDITDTDKSSSAEKAASTTTACGAEVGRALQKGKQRNTETDEKVSMEFWKLMKSNAEFNGIQWKPKGTGGQRLREPAKLAQGMVRTSLTRRYKRRSGAGAGAGVTAKKKLVDVTVVLDPVDQLFDVLFSKMECFEKQALAGYNQKIFFAVFNSLRKKRLEPELAAQLEREFPRESLRRRLQKGGAAFVWIDSALTAVYPKLMEKNQINAAFELLAKVVARAKKHKDALKYFSEKDTIDLSKNDKGEFNPSRLESVASNLLALCEQPLEILAVTDDHRVKLHDAYSTIRNLVRQLGFRFLQKEDKDAFDARWKTIKDNYNRIKNKKAAAGSEPEQAVRRRGKRMKPLKAVAGGVKMLVNGEVVDANSPKGQEARSSRVSGTRWRAYNAATEVNEVSRRAKKKKVKKAASTQGRLTSAECGASARPTASQSMAAARKAAQSRKAASTGSMLEGLGGASSVSAPVGGVAATVAAKAAQVANPRSNPAYWPRLNSPADRERREARKAGDKCFESYFYLYKGCS